MSTAEEKFDELQWVLDAIQDGFLTLDAERRVRAANAATAGILGRSREALTGLTIYEIFPKVEPARIDELLSGQLAELSLPKPNMIPYLGTPSCRIIARAIAQGYQLILVDLTEKLRQEAELARLTATMALSQELLRHKNEELDQSLERMERLNQQLAALDDLKSQFLSNTSHELRTPMNTILGALQLVRDGLCENPEEEAEYLNTALEAARRLLKVINAMLDSAKLSAGKMNFLIEDYGVNGLLDEVYSMLNPIAREKGLQLTCDAPADPELFVRADFEKVKQALLNLVGNAIKFTEKGTIAVTVKALPEQPDAILFSVRDTGIGIPLDRQIDLFESFTQVDGSATRCYEGAGLGLAITKNLVEMMGGAIALNSEGTGKGTEITFTLPAGSSKQQSGRGTLSDEDLLTELPKTF